MTLPTTQQNVWDLINTSLTKQHDDLNKPVKKKPTKAKSNVQLQHRVKAMDGPCRGQVQAFTDPVTETEFTFFHEKIPCTYRLTAKGKPDRFGVIEHECRFVENFTTGGAPWEWQNEPTVRPNAEEWTFEEVQRRAQESQERRLRGIQALEEQEQHHRFMQMQKAVLGQSLTGGRSQGKSKASHGLLEGLGSSVENHERLEQSFHKPKTGKLTR